MLVIRSLSTLFLALMLTEVAMGQSPFGVGLPESQPISSDGVLSGFFTYVREQQSYFYRRLTDTLKAMKEDGSATWLLMGMSFLYGIFHAAGPGHGKVVLTSYVLANRETAKRGAFLCLASSLVQALSAIFIITALTIMLRFTSIFVTEVTYWITQVSFALVIGLGLYLLWQIVRSTLVGGHHDHSHCDHDHAPNIAIAEKSFSSLGTKNALLAVFSVGIRPCTGALIVLTFAYASGLYWAGLLSALVMGLGTAITTSSLMLIATSGRKLMLGFSDRNGAIAAYGIVGLQLFGAALLILMGLTLFIANF